jgi:pseudoazurin
MRIFGTLISALCLLGASGAVQAADVTVSMKNKGDGGMMVFEPDFVRVNVGDRVHFIPASPGHNAELIPGMAPAGITAPAGAMSKEWVLTVGKPGLYGIKCAPHFGLGMVALVQAGAGPSPNAAAARAVTLPPLAAKRMNAALAKSK